MQCSICSHPIKKIGTVVQVFRKHGLVVTITGIPAVASCPVCGNVVLAWDVAQQVEDLVKAVFT